MTLTDSNNSQLRRWRLWLLTFRRLDHMLFPSPLHPPSSPVLLSGDSPPFHSLLRLYPAFVFPLKPPPSLRLLLLPMPKVWVLGFNSTISSSFVSKISPMIRICFSNSVLHHSLLLSLFLRKIYMLVVSDSDFSIRK